LTDTRPPSRKRCWTQALFALGILAVFLAALEIVLRMTHLWGAAVSWSEPDPRLGYRYSPGKAYWYHKENDHAIEGRINRFGWRDRDWTLEKPPGVYRVAVLGDSFVEAFQVESDRTFLAVAETRFNAAPCGVRVELMNFGRSGYTQTEEWIVLKDEAVRFSPDLVVLFYYPGNDIEDVSRETSPESDRPFFRISDGGDLIADTSFTRARRYRIRCVLNKIKQHSALVSLVGERYNLYKTLRAYDEKRREAGLPPVEHGARAAEPAPRAPGSRAEAGTPPDRPAQGPPASPAGRPLPGYLSLCTDRPDPAHRRSYRLSKALIGEMAGFCRARGIRFLILVMFDPDYLPEKEAELRAEDPSYDPRFFEKDLEAHARLLGADFLELHAPARLGLERGGDPLVKVHLNYEGHELAGAVLAGKLAEIVCGGGPRP